MSRKRKAPFRHTEEYEDNSLQLSTILYFHGNNDTDLCTECYKTQKEDFLKYKMKEHILDYQCAMEGLAIDNINSFKIWIIIESGQRI